MAALALLICILSSYPQAWIFRFVMKSHLNLKQDGKLTTLLSKLTYNENVQWISALRQSLWWTLWGLRSSSDGSPWTTAALSGKCFLLWCFDQFHWVITMRARTRYYVIAYQIDVLKTSCVTSGQHCFLNIILHRITFITCHSKTAKMIKIYFDKSVVRAHSL